MRMSKKTVLNLEYSSIHGFYWMAYAGLSSFASVFLLSRGYSNTEIGIMFAVSNVLAVFFQPVLADIADRSKRFSLPAVSAAANGVLMIFVVGMLLIQKRHLALTVIYVMALAGHTSLQPLFNSLCFRISKSGVKVNFGISRAIGSLAFSVLSLFLGTLAEDYGVMVLPLTAELTLAMVMVSLALVAFQLKKLGAATVEASEKATDEAASAATGVAEGDVESVNLIQFARRNKMFILFMSGALGLYFSNGVLNNFMLQIIQPLGGGSEDMGRIFSVMAVLEIPTMVCFELINRKISCQNLLRIAAVGYVLKTGIIWLADSVNMVFLAHGFQLISFALFLPAIVKFIDLSMDEGEKVKGQALFTTVTTIAYVICSLTGGFILDHGGAKMLMFISVIMCTAGAAIICGTVGRIKKN